MLTHETNHLQRLLELLPLQYQGLARWEALMVRSWAADLQRLEDAADDLLVQLQLETATGAWLDLWGQLLQLPNTAGASDDTYRAILRARAAAIRTNGSPKALVEAATLFLDTDAGESGRLIETPPASAVVELSTDADPGVRTLMAEVLYSAAPAGVRLLVVQHPLTGDEEGGGFDVTPLEAQASYDARRANTWTIPEQRWLADEIADGDLRMDMFGDPL